ncbi:hypothetical protein Peur_052996 [Populus x canadensis]|uniref:CCR4-NOT transcription complex subunit 11 n=1 Tax=Populus deltoides TaxID=3696 RepID=A0A8T2Z4Q0_POPDE|nr:hypothetical protein H0E87_009518 [Populus deltoides]
MTLSFEEMNLLYSLLRSEQRPIDEIVTEFINNINRSRSSTLSASLSLLLQAACDEGAEKYERAFVLQLLASGGSGGSKEFVKQSAANYIKVFDPSVHAFPSRQHLQHQYGDEVHLEADNSLFKNISLKNIVPDPDVPHGCDANSQELDLQPGVKPKLGSGDRDKALTGLVANLSP